MKVKEIIIETMGLIGRRDAAEIYKSEGEEKEENKEVSSLAYTLLHCYNAVFNELARGYFYLRDTQSFVSDSGYFPFKKFNHVPVRINRVFGDGERVRWRILPYQLQANCKKITVDYNYSPAVASYDDDFDYGSIYVSSYLVECGMAAEYFFVNGEIEFGKMWESKYRGEIERQMSLVPVADRVPPRRWL